MTVPRTSPSPPDQGPRPSPVTLRHAAVVDHEEVDLEVVGAGPPDVVVLGADEVDHLDTAAVALPGAGHRALQVSSKMN